MSTTANKVKYNLKNTHYAILTETVTDGVPSYSYATPVQMPGAVSMSLDAEGSNDPFYADGIVYFRANSNNGYSGDAEFGMLPESFRTDVLKESLDTNNVLIEDNKSTETVKFALLFEFDGDAKAIRHVMYNCSAARPTISSETKEDKITPSTEKLSITADPRSDGLIKAKTGDTTTDTAYNEWYTSVYVPVPVVTP